MNKTISIMPDFGNAPYAWVKDSVDTSRCVGSCAAGYLEPPESFRISDELHNRFVAWCQSFENLCESPDFRWSQFHKEGLDLARQLKSQVGDAFKVQYVYPREDTETSFREPIEVR